MKNNYLTVKINGTDYSNKAYLMDNSNIEVSLVANTGIIEVSYKKPLKAFYIDLEQGSTAGATMTAQMWDGSTWANCGLLDETQGLKKSGFIFLDEELKVKDSVYPVRFSLSANSGVLKIRGLSVEFCNELDLKLIAPAIDRFIPRGYNTHINSIEAATKTIIQKINNMGKYKYKDDVVSQINRYDFQNIEEIRLAATFLSLHYIYQNLSDSGTDDYKAKSAEYLKKFNEAFKVFQNGFLTLDLDDDGKTSVDERAKAMTQIRMIR